MLMVLSLSHQMERNILCKALAFNPSSPTAFMLISYRDPRSSVLYDCDRFVSRLCGQGGVIKEFSMFGACERF